MAYIGVNATADFVTLKLNNSADFSSNISAAFDDAGETTNTLTVPSMQEITVNATPGIFRWKQLDALSEKAVTTASTNNIELTVVLDDTSFFSNTGSSYGILDSVNNKTKTAFRLYWAGNDSGDRYIQGEGYLSALAPTVSPDSPVWTSPLTLEIIGDFTTGTED